MSISGSAGFDATTKFKLNDYNHALNVDCYNTGLPTIKTIGVQADIVERTKHTSTKFIPSECPMTPTPSAPTKVINDFIADSRTPIPGQRLLKKEIERFVVLYRKDQEVVTEENGVKTVVTKERYIGHPRGAGSYRSQGDGLVTVTFRRTLTEFDKSRLRHQGAKMLAELETSCSVSQSTSSPVSSSATTSSTSSTAPSISIPVLPLDSRSVDSGSIPTSPSPAPSIGPKPKRMGFVRNPTSLDLNTIQKAAPAPTVPAPIVAIKN